MFTQNAVYTQNAVTTVARNAVLATRELKWPISAGRDQFPLKTAAGLRKPCYLGRSENGRESTVFNSEVSNTLLNVRVLAISFESVLLPTAQNPSARSRKNRRPNNAAKTEGKSEGEREG